MMRADPRFKPLPREVSTLLTEGKLIEAIKVLRRNNGLDLGQAKTWIDSHIAQDPMLRVHLEAQQRVTRRKFFTWFLLVDAVIAAAIIYFMLYRGTA
jgi:hypothetical protein